MIFKRKHLIISIIFIISIIASTTIITETIYYIYKESFIKSNISKKEVTLSLFGKDIPNEKVKTFNSLVPKDMTPLEEKPAKEGLVKSLLIISTPSIVSTFLIVTLYDKFKRNRAKNKWIKEQTIKRNNYIKKYSLVGKKNSFNCIDGNYSNKEIIGKELIAWTEENSIVFVNRDYAYDIGEIKIDTDSIICFSRYGDFYTSLNIKGGDSSYGRAALGYLFAGASGAIIAIRNPISSETILHDNRETLLFIKDNDEERHIFFDPQFYDFLMHLIPNKEMNYIVKKQEKHSDDNKLNKLMELSNLKEKGHITDDEFTKLKQELIG